MGIVNVIFKDENLVSEVLTRAVRLSQMPLGSLRATKHLLRHAQAQALRAVTSLEKEVAAERLQREEVHEAFQAFAEGRKPNFS